MCIRDSLSAVKPDRSVALLLASGAKLVGKLHPSISYEQARDLVGRTLDLKSAYRQLPVSPASCWASVVSVFQPGHEEPALFLQRALPFGATASVYAFNRYARAIWHLGVAVTDLWWTQFFDDYPMVSLVVNAVSARETAHSLLSIICLLYTSPSPRDRTRSRMPSSA